MNNMYDPSSPIRDRKMTDKQLSKTERPDGLLHRKEKANNVADSEKDKFEKVYVREDKVSKKKSAEEIAAAAKNKKKSIFKSPPSNQGYTPSSHEQAMRKSFEKKESEKKEPTVGSVTSPTAHAPIELGNESIGISTLGQQVQSSAKASELQEIIDQIVDKLYIIQQKGNNDTLMTLRQPPILKGAVLKLSAFENAPKEFNLSFSGLTQEGKGLLDTNQSGLMRGLEKHGFVVHIVVTSTVDDPASLTAEHADKSDDEQEKGRQEHNQQDDE